MLLGDTMLHFNKVCHYNTSFKYFARNIPTITQKAIVIKNIPNHVIALILHPPQFSIWMFHLFVLGQH